MKRALLFLGVVALLTAAGSASADILVKQDGSGDYTTINAAITAAITAGGTQTIDIGDSDVYTEQINGNGNAGNITIQSAPGQHPTLYTFLYTSGAGAYTISNVKFDATVGTNTDGQAAPVQARTGTFTLQNSQFVGSSSFSYDSYLGNASSLTFNNDTFTIVKGVYMKGDNPATVENCLFTIASGQRGFWTDSGGRTTGATYFNNNIFVGGAQAVYWDSQVGGEGSGAVFTNNTFYNQTSAALRIKQNSVGPMPTLTNNLFWEPVVGMNGNGWSVSTYPVTYNGFETNPPTDFASSVDNLNLLTGATGNVLNNTDPFINDAGGDYRLQNGSWAATAGAGGTYIGALAPAPEPMTLALLTLGGLAFIRRRR